MYTFYVRTGDNDDVPAKTDKPKVYVFYALRYQAKATAINDVFVISNRIQKEGEDHTQIHTHTHTHTHACAN